MTYKSQALFRNTPLTPFRKKGKCFFAAVGSNTTIEWRGGEVLLCQSQEFRAIKIYRVFHGVFSFWKRCWLVRTNFQKLVFSGKQFSEISFSNLFLGCFGFFEKVTFSNFDVSNIARLGFVRFSNKSNILIMQLNNIVGLCGVLMLLR